MDTLNSHVLTIIVYLQLLEQAYAYLNLNTFYLSFIATLALIIVNRHGFVIFELFRCEP